MHIKSIFKVLGIPSVQKNLVEIIEKVIMIYNEILTEYLFLDIAKYHVTIYTYTNHAQQLYYSREGCTAIYITVGNPARSGTLHGREGCTVGKVGKRKIDF